MFSICVQLKHADIGRTLCMGCIIQILGSLEGLLISLAEVTAAVVTCTY